ncbi:MAG: hypothetical protein ACRD12_18430 [Acidimicrobiales bacterium]
MARGCPACRKEWPAEREVCGDCLAALVDDLDATVTCRHCGQAWPSRMQSCPDCLAELAPDPERVVEAMQDMAARGMHLPRPAGTPPFADGVGCTLRRANPRSSLMFVGPTGFVEAYVNGRDHSAAPPLDGNDIDGTRLFRLDVYAAHEDAVVATDPGGTPLATFLRTGGLLSHKLEVRDETSAPVGRLKRSGTGWSLFETGGEELAHLAVGDTQWERYVDDEWSLRLLAGTPLPLKPLGAVAMVLAAKVLLGRRRPEPVERPTVEDDYGDQMGDVGVRVSWLSGGF